MSDKDELKVAETTKLLNPIEETSPPSTDDNTSQFVGLPIESLICKPIIAAAQGEQELTAVYMDNLKEIAYNGDDSNTLFFKYKRPVIKPDGSIGESEEMSINAPLLSLVPVPAFTMDELNVNFNMEVKSMDMSERKIHEDVSSTVSYNSWFGLDASITGNVSSNSTHKRQTDNSATYSIHAGTIQQPPSEGRAKLTSLLAQAMESIKTK